MTAFQLVVAPLATLLCLRSVVGLLKGARPRWAAVLRAVIWLGAAVAVTWPDATTTVANMLGIGRGADLVIYLVAIAFVAGFFFLYHRYRRVEASVTALTRYLALRDAEAPQPSFEVDGGPQAPEAGASDANGK